MTAAIWIHIVGGFVKRLGRVLLISAVPFAHFASGYQSVQAQAAAQPQLSHVISTFNKAVREKSGKEAYKKTIVEAQKIKDEYASTPAARIAQYYIALSEENLGNTAKAIENLTELIQTDEGSIKALAQLALASLYKNHGDNEKALEVYEQLNEGRRSATVEDHPSHHTPH